MRSDNAIEAAITRGHCPDCNHRGFVLGPRGGVAQNIECGNLDCRARFNVCVYAGQAVFAQRIPREREGGSRWGTFGKNKHEGSTSSPGIGWP